MLDRRTFLLGAVATACTRTTDAPPWGTNVVRSDALAREIAGPEPRPRIVHVGPKVLFDAAHVPGAVHAGKAGDADGLEEVAKYLAALPRDASVVLYCGCCPYEHCPNIRPAWARAQKVGLARVRVLDLPTNLDTDWTGRGLPVEGTG